MEEKKRGTIGGDKEKEEGMTERPCLSPTNPLISSSPSENQSSCTENETRGVSGPCNNKSQGAVVDKPVHRVPNGSTLAPSKIAAVLALNDMGVPKREIARQENLSPTTVHALIKQGDQHNPGIVERIKKHIAAHWYVTTERSLNGITDEKIEKSSAAQLAVIASIGTEKALLAEGKATVRVEFTNTDPELQGEIERLEAERDAWKQGKIINVDSTMGSNNGEDRRNDGVETELRTGAEVLAEVSERPPVDPPLPAP